MKPADIELIYFYIISLLSAILSTDETKVCINLYSVENKPTYLWGSDRPRVAICYELRELVIKILCIVA